MRNSKIWNNYQTGGPIGTKFGTRLRIHLGMDIGLKQLSPLYPRGHFGGFRGSEIQKSGRTTKFGIPQGAGAF